MAVLLIVEDDTATNEAICEYMSSAGHTTLSALDGEQGLQIAREKSVDLVVLDIMLPKRTGLEVLKELRRTSSIPVLMLTALDDEPTQAASFDEQADDYITKPFSPSELVARVKAHLARYERLIGSTAQKNDIIEIRGIRIDKTARRVWVNEEEKQFTTKEFDLLTFLAENPNHVFTKDELFSKIWDMESIGDIATVTVHIKKIREKIEFNTAKPQYIETIWGVGYRFKL